MNDQRGLDLRPLFRLFWQGKFILAICALLGVLIFGFHAFYIATPQFKATSVVILETRREEIVDLQTIVSGLSGKVTEINTEMEVLRGRVLMGRVADDLGLLTDPEFNTSLVPDSLRTRVKHALRRFLLGPDPSEISRDNPDWERESVINALLHHTSVQAVPSSYVFRISATSSDPIKAARIADAVAAHYMASQIEVKEAATADAARAFSERVDLLQADLAEAEARIAAFSAARDVDVAGDMADTRADIANAQASLERLRDRQIALATAANPAALVRAGGDDTLRALLNGIGEPGGQTAFDARLATVANLIDAEITETEGEVATLNTALTALQSRAVDATTARRDLDRLERDADATRALYEDFLTRLKETEAQQGMVQADSRILSDAIVPNYHISPRRSQMIAMGLIFGLVLGAALIVLREALVNTFRSSTDLATRSGLAVLGQVPIIPGGSRPGILRNLRDRPQSIAAEAVRNLRTSLALTGDDTTLPRIIMSTSCLPDEGKTTLAVALAQNLAAMGRSVVLVDGDLRRSAFEEYFGAGTGKGLMAVLSQDTPLEEALFAAEPFGFDVLLGATAGSPGVPDILSSDGFADLMALLAETYDVVIIDSPPVLIVPDARIIGRLAEAILFSVRWNSTTRSQLTQGLRQLDGLGPKPALVLTQVDASAAPDAVDLALSRRGAAYFQS